MEAGEMLLAKERLCVLRPPLRTQVLGYRGGCREGPVSMRRVTRCQPPRGCLASELGGTWVGANHPG